jgi:hypothetical protein
LISKFVPFPHIYFVLLVKQQQNNHEKVGGMSSRLWRQCGLHVCVVEGWVHCT